MLRDETPMHDRDLRGFDGGSARTTKGAGILKGSPPSYPLSPAEGLVDSWMDRSQDDDKFRPFLRLAAKNIDDDVKCTNNRNM